MTEPPALVVGLMSGTSLDGMDAALVRIRASTEVELVGFVHRPYDPVERSRLEQVLSGGPIADVARLHAALGDWAVEAIERLLQQTHQRADGLTLIAFPGQTIWHEPPVVTWQLGDATRIAEHFGVRVVHDFRARDVAAGGEGAPLVPLVDALCFAAHDRPRVLLNIGGMANATWVAGRARLDEVVAGDSGPGMAVIDALARMIDPALPYDAGGALAGRGRVDPEALARRLADPFFGQPPPRSTGREQFGRDYAARLLREVPGPDAVATAMALTVESIAGFCERFLPPAEEVVVSGGGTQHPVLMRALTERLAGSGRTLARFDERFFAAAAKEAVAFGVLGWLTLHGQPGSLPRVTGARSARVLGSIVPA
ncbi:MAG TPA: anhydro-N-acetylmuramic acid kinase [Gemmatimonadales bacterium]|nr:anhydro-N-acetylmuramic acid kinase [Gemmatimonadales bacterium]